MAGGAGGAETDGIIIDEAGLHSLTPFAKERPAHCIFELIYFSRPDSQVFGENVYLCRKRLGHNLAREYRPDVDFAMPFPDSGNYAALGYAEESGLPFEMGMIRNHYVGRTFIEPAPRTPSMGSVVGSTIGAAPGTKGPAGAGPRFRPRDPPGPATRRRPARGRQAHRNRNVRSRACPRGRRPARTGRPARR